MLTPDLSPTFFSELDKVCATIRCNKAHLLAVMMAESGVRAKAHNQNCGAKHVHHPACGASGLIQFMPDTLRLLGWSAGPEAFRRLAAHQQLPFVESYYRPHRGKLATTAALYCATFLPADIDHAADPSFVLVQRGGRRGWAFDANAAFDANRDLAITVAELDLAIRRQCRGPRWEEIAQRAEILFPGRTLSRGPADLHTTLGIQEALVRHGFDPGPLDGYPGPRTRAAVEAFQRSRGLDVDAIVGPITRAALAAIPEVVA